MRDGLAESVVNRRKAPTGLLIGSLDPVGSSPSSHNLGRNVPISPAFCESNGWSAFAYTRIHETASATPAAEKLVDGKLLEGIGTQGRENTHNPRLLDSDVLY